MFGQALVSVFIAFSLSGSALARPLSGGISFRTWGEFQNLPIGGAQALEECPMLTCPLAGKVYGGSGGEVPLTNAEYVAPAGDVP